MAENRTINIKINQNADKAEQDFKSYNKELGNTKKQYDAVLKSGKPFDQQLEDINRIVKETPLNVRDMNKQIQAYQSIALSAGRETPVGRKALEEAAQLRDRYVNIQNETKRLADDQRTLEGAMQGVSTGVAVFGGVQAAMALSGVESEKLRETMVKLQAAQVLMNSVNQVATALEKESALLLAAKSVQTKAVTVATAAYAAVTGGATGALKLFRIALASTGIGAIVVGVGLLIANFDKLAPVIKKVIDFALAPMKLVIDGLISAYYALTDALGFTSKAEREREKQAKQHAAASRKRNQQLMEEYKKEKAAIQANIDATRRYQKAQERRYNRQIELLQAEGKDTRKLEAEKVKLNVETQEQILKDRIKAYKAAMKTNNGLAKINNRLLLQAQKQALKDAQFEALKFDKATNKIKSDNYKTYAKDRLDATRRIQDIENSLLEDGIDKELKLSEVKFKRLIEDTKKNTKLTREERNRLIELYEDQGQQKAEEIRAKYRQKEIDAERKLQAKLAADENAFLDQIAAIQDANYEMTLSDQEREIRAVQEKYFTLETLAEGNAEALLEIENSEANEINNINIKYDEEERKREKQRQKQSVSDAKAEMDRKLAFANQTLDTISALTDAFSKDSEESQKRAFKINKAVSLTGAVINTAAAVAAALNPAVGGLAAPAGIPGAVLAGLTGLAQIATIAKQQFQGGGGEADITPASEGAGAITPEFNVVGDSGVNQLAQIQQQPIQAYVVSGEVTTSQALDRNRVENATL